MTKSYLYSAALLLTPAIFCNTSLAQEEAPPNIGAVEIYMCSYAEGKDAADLGKVVNKWNGWMDKDVATPYSAWTLTPVITGSYFEGDIGWLGAYQNGSDMGKVTQSWVSESGDLPAAFDAVIPCDNHSIYSSVNYKAPEGEDWPGKNGSSSVTVFSDCTVAEGKTLEDIDAVHTAWAEHLTARGSKAGFWSFLPAYGADRINGHYKVVVGYPSYEDWGNDHNDYTNGGGWRKGRELSEGVIQCDSPRVYHTTLQRNGGVTAN